jgi:hypothetical protein
MDDMTMTDSPPAIYRLLPGMGDFRMLLLTETSHARLTRYLRTGSPEQRPTHAEAVWDGPPELRPAEFASGLIGAPIFSRRVADLMSDDLTRAGGFVPLAIDGSDTGEYVLYVVDEVVDCLDTRRSSKPKRATGQIKKMVFRADAVPAELPALRVPEYPVAVCWADPAVDRLTKLLGDDLEARLIWSADSSLTPHPDPWGF